MYRPPLQLANTDISIEGDVTIHPSAVISAGVVLHARSNCRIIIGAGVCLGMGSILNASLGLINIQDGAMIGAGVLIVGRGSIGSNACIGTASTLIETDISAQTILPAYSLINDSCPPEESLDFLQNETHFPSTESEVSPATDQIVPSPWDIPLEEDHPIPLVSGPPVSFLKEEQSLDPNSSVEEIPTIVSSAETSTPVAEPPTPEAIQEEIAEIVPPPPTITPSEVEDTPIPLFSGPPVTPPSLEKAPLTETPVEDKSSKNGGEITQQPVKTGSPVVGKMYINQLLVTLFPHKQQSS